MNIIVVIYILSHFEVDIAANKYFTNKDSYITEIDTCSNGLFLSFCSDDIDSLIANPNTYNCYNKITIEFCKISSDPSLQLYDSLSFYKLDTLFSKFSSLPNLFELNINHYPFSKLPPSFSQLNQIKTLRIRNSIYLKEPNLGVLDSVVNLDFDYCNNLNENLFWSSITEICNLKSIDMNSTNIHSISDSIYKLQHLEYLGISNDNFTYISEKLYSLNKLNTLLITNTKLPMSEGVFFNKFKRNIFLISK